jgi:uncharacterized Tic20 family protein
MQGQPMPGQQMSGPPMRPDEEKMWAIGAHLGPLLLGFIAPLVVWLVFRDRSGFLNRHGKEALNFQISLLIYFTVSFVLWIIIIGILMTIALAIAAVIFMVLATVKAANFEDYRYPATIRFIK